MLPNGHKLKCPPRTSRSKQFLKGEGAQNKSDCIWEKRRVAKTTENWRTHDYSKMEAVTHLRWLMPCKKAVSMLLAITNDNEQL